MLFRERIGHDGAPGRLFLATGGVIYPILVPDSLETGAFASLTVTAALGPDLTAA